MKIIFLLAIYLKWGSKNQKNMQLLACLLTKTSSNQKLTYYNTTTKKQEEVEFYDYFLHLEKFGLKWQDASIEFKYSVELSTNKKN